jgi:6-phosphogluconolactonase
MDSLSKNRIIKIFSNDNDLFSTAAQDFAQRAIAAVTAKSEFNVVLSGGNTPKLFFDTLTKNPEYRQKIPWRQIKFFFGDERYVPADDPGNNYNSAKQHLFSKVSVSAENIFPIPTGFSDPQDSARSYEVTICKVHFDLIYLGLGDDAHTASLMPGTDIVRDYAQGKAPHQLVAALWAPQQKMYRITLTPCAINHSECICFLVTGASKAAAVSSVLEGAFDPERFPAQLIHSADEKIVWYLDQEAAGGKYRHCER